MTKQPACGNDPAMSRRGVLTGTVAGIAAALTAGNVAAATDLALASDPHRAWFEEWKSLRAAWLAEPGDRDGNETAHEKALWNASKEIEDKLSETSASTLDGAAAQLEWVLDDSSDMDFQVGHREALELVLGSLKGGLV